MLIRGSKSIDHLPLHDTVFQRDLGLAHPSLGQCSRRRDGRLDTSIERRAENSFGGRVRSQSFGGREKGGESKGLSGSVCCKL